MEIRVVSTTLTIVDGIFTGVSAGSSLFVVFCHIFLTIKFVFLTHSESFVILAFPLHSVLKEFIASTLTY